MSNFLGSSIGKKLIMSLAGLFLIVFLIVHLGINLLVLLESPEAFNRAAHFMGTNVIVKIMEIVLFGGLLLHMLYACIVTIQNWIARPRGYKKANYSQTSVFSKYMFHTAVVLTIFLVLHLLDFYIKSEFFGELEEVNYDGKIVHNLASLVIARFQIKWVVWVYLIALLGLGFHLHHGFQSAFQTLGINHPVYTPVIKTAGVIYTVLITGGFMSIPILVFYLK
ncbi:MAG: succinate dehydrogenase cytochrome b subunit [Bacteroidales bacterium]|nr:succinate dehydrogenase cytochrome b subunit [Bacteroidales bacterium]